MPRESAISQRIVEALNQLPGCHAEKRWTGGIYSRVGEPDVTGCIGGRRIEIEVKVPGKQPRKVQAKRLRDWAEAGAIVGSVTSIEEALALVQP